MIDINESEFGNVRKVVGADVADDERKWGSLLLDRNELKKLAPNIVPKWITEFKLSDPDSFYVKIVPFDNGSKSVNVLFGSDKKMNVRNYDSYMKTVKVHLLVDLNVLTRQPDLWGVIEKKFSSL